VNWLTVLTDTSMYLSLQVCVAPWSLLCTILAPKWWWKLW